MPSPSASLATLRSDLGGSMEAFDLQADRAGFIGLRVFPVFEAAMQSGSFGKIPLDQLLKNRDTERSPGSGYSRGKFTFTPASYATEEHGAEEPVDDREARLYADYFDAEMVAAERARDVVLRNFEKRIAAAVFNATTWNGAALTTGITHEWDDPANATPQDDVEAACRKVYANSGLWPNTLIINRNVFRNLRKCDDVIDKVSSSGAGSSVLAENISVQMLAAYFDLERILVAGGAQNAANEGQDASIEHIWSGEFAMVCRTATRPRDIREPCLGRTIHWGADGSMIGGVFESYREESIRGNVVRHRMETDELIMYVEAGHLLSNITT